MKFFRSFYHFLGSVYFALILISAVTLFVIAGTVIESLTQSHRYAALFTYDNPVFAALLWGFFINILFSATRRWPFRWKHVPFLTTHLGLLMILAGVLAKHYFGLQGTLMLSEGAASQEVLLPHTFGIQVDKKEGGEPLLYPLQKNFDGTFNDQITINNDPFSIRLAEFHPHCEAHLASWIKCSHAVINGLRPIPLHEVEDSSKEKLPIGAKVRFSLPEAEIWHLYALKTADKATTLSKLYAQNSHLKITDRKSGELLLEIPLEEILDHSSDENQPLSATLALNFSPIEGFQNPLLKVAFRSKDLIVIPLTGSKALLNLDALDQEMHVVPLPISLEVVQQPILGIIEDELDDVFLIAFYPQGKVMSESFRKGHLDRLTAYDDGFLGYSVNSTLPFALETMVAPVQKVVASGKKLEDNVPKVAFYIQKGTRTQTLSLAYDRIGNGLKWPILDGEYKIRFQPLFKEIPYRLRLRQARQINYANSSQPYSFESDLIVTDRRTGEIVEKTISMNQVHETWDGYRFYLSSINPPNETAMKYVQMAVNYDPAKYLLTYPGAIVLSCGIIMLFTMRPYRRQREHDHKG